MRILMIQTDSMFPCFHGGSKANKRLMEAFAERGHEAFVLFSYTDQHSDESFIQKLSSLLIDKEIESTYPLSNRDTIRFNFRNVHYIGVRLESGRLLPFIRIHLNLLAPERVCISEIGGSLALPIYQLLDELESGKIVYLPKTVECLPFGPYSVELNPIITQILKQKTHIITASHFVSEYIKKHADIRATPYYFPLYEKEIKFRQQYDIRNKYITLFNGSFWKGLTIFIACAKKLPQYSFMMVKGWGTKEEDLQSLVGISNISVCDFNPQVDIIFEQSLCVLAPSIWHEAFGQVVIQSMQRGIPVITSDKGGLPEAKMGTEYILPVPDGGGNMSPEERKLIDFESTFSNWANAINNLCNNEKEWNRLSNHSYDAANRFIKNNTWDPILNEILNLS